jgi:hypothetical protein
MKKLIFISILSLMFMAAGAQRPSKSGSSENRSNERKKSEMTVRRSSDQKNRSYNNNRNNTSGSTTYGTKTHSDENSNSYDNRKHDNNGNMTYRSKSYSGNNNRSGNRNTAEKIYNRSTDLHKNHTREKVINQESRRVHSSSGRSGNTYHPDKNASHRKVYQTPNRTVYHRHVTHVKRPRSLEYRRIYHAYRAPVHIHVVWTNRMYREYRLIYPEYRYWYYPVGYRINTISAYDAGFYIGEVMNVYGRINDVWYSRKTDEYFLHFGAPYPYHDFTVIIPGHEARHFARHPEFFFENRNIWVTGLISLYDGKPEMVVRKKYQIHLY